MGYSPVSVVVQPPVTPEAGTLLLLQPDTGDRFPLPPFTYLAWPAQTIPTLGVDSEEGTVLTIEGDTVTIARPSNAVAITNGMQFAAQRTIPIYSLGQDVTLTGLLPEADTDQRIVLRTPQGEVSEYSGTQLADNGDGSFSYTFKLEDSGLWWYRWDSDQTVDVDSPLFVRHSPTLD